MSDASDKGLSLRGFQAGELAPIDLDIAPGECIALSGPSGCGKSRLLRALGDLDPHAGNAYLDRQPLRQTPPPEWRQQVGLLPAESHWWDESVGVHFGESDTDLLQALELPAECLQWSVSRLSSGERQRLALARLLSNHPRVLLLDEPTANLDDRNAKRVETLVENYRQQHRAAVLWVSHDPAQRQRVAQRHYLFAQGNLEPETWS